MNERELTCPVCGTVFTTNHPSKKYCSAECRKIQNSRDMRNFWKSDKGKKYRHNYYKKHKEEINRKCHEYYLDHKEEILEKQKAYRKEYNRYYYQQLKVKKCCAKHGGIDNCPYSDCICE